MHIFFSLMRGSRRKRLTRAQRRKLANNRRRWFTDNIIMHHKRLHDRNREDAIASAKSRIMANKLSDGEETLAAPKQWRERFDVRDRGRTVRGRVDARRMRARSRWMSVLDTPDGEEDKGGFEMGNVH